MDGDLTGERRDGDVPARQFGKLKTALIRDKSSLYRLDRSVNETLRDHNLYSPSAGKATFEIINNSLRGEDSRFRLAEDKIKAVTKTEEGFIKALQAMVDNNAGIVYGSSNLLVHVLPPEYIKDAISRAGIDHRFLISFTDYKELFTQDQQREYLTPLLQQEGTESANGVLSLFQDKDAVALFPEGQLHDALLNAGLGTDQSLSRLMWNDKDGLLTRHKSLTLDDFQKIVMSHIHGLKDMGSLGSYLKYLPSDPQVLEEIKEGIVVTYTERAKVRDLENLLWIKEWFTPEVRYEIVRGAMQRDSLSSGGDFENCQRLVTPEQFAQSLRAVILDPELNVSGRIVKSVLHSTLRDEEKAQFINHLVSTDRADELLHSFDLVNKYIKDERNQDAVFVAIFKNLSNGFRIGYLPNVSPRRQRLVLNSFSAEDIDLLLGLSNEGGDELDINAINHRVMSDFLRKHKDTRGDLIISQLREFVPLFIAKGNREAFVRDLIQANPVAALLQMHKDPTIFEKVGGFAITSEDIVQGSRADTSGYLSLAPRTIAEFYKRFSFSKTQDEQKTLIAEANNLNRIVRFIRSEGMESDFKRILSSESLSIKQEQELLSIFECFVLLKRNDPSRFAHLTQSVTTFENARQILFDQFGQFFERDQPFTTGEIENFFTTMGTATPFMEYLLQYQSYEDYPEQVQMLGEIFDSLVAGKFPEWKYGDGSEAALQLFKEAGFLPKNLTQEQYTQWCKDEQTSTFESLAVDTQRIADAIKRYLGENSNHLDLQETSMDAIKPAMSTAGQELAALNKELSVIRDDPARVEEVAGLEERKMELEKKIKKLARDRRILRLMNITADDVAAGYFFEGEQKRRGEDIDKVLDGLKSSAGSANEFVYEQVETLLQSTTAVSERQNLICTDSSDPKLWIEIGEQPVATCQSYHPGDFNEGLLGYTGPDTKILALTNERGSLVGRAILRLLSTQGGNPALHLERIYTSSASKAVDTTIIARAHAKAQAMGMPLLVSSFSQNEAGTIVQFELPESFTASPAGYPLFAKASRAPSVYVDSHGGISDGEFELEELLQIQKAGAA